MLRWIVAVVGAFNCARSVRVEQEGASSIKTSDEVLYSDAHVTSNIPGEDALKLRLFTWNSDKTKLQNAAIKLMSAQPDVDALVTCQQEATTPLSDFIGDEWVHVAFGKNLGATGFKFTQLHKTVNGQYLSVFWKTTDRLKTDIDAHSFKWSSGTQEFQFKDHFTNKSFSLKTDTKTHRTSAWGKGGVSTSLYFNGRKLHILCAHLDSKQDDLKMKGLFKMLVDTQGIGLADDVILLGDLNFRLSSHYLSNQSTLAQKMSTPDGRMEMAKADPLYDKPDASVEKSLLVEAEGFGFRCNQPYQKYRPTYNLKRAKKAQKAGKDFGCFSDKEITPQNIEECYKSKEGRWKKKKGTAYWQLGWLDRFCWKSKDASRMHLEDEVGFASLGVGPDHLAASAVLTLTYQTS